MHRWSFLSGHFFFTTVNKEIANIYIFPKKEFEV